MHTGVYMAAALGRPPVGPGQEGARESEPWSTLCQVYTAVKRGDFTEEAIGPQCKAGPTCPQKEEDVRPGKISNSTLNGQRQTRPRQFTAPLAAFLSM